jgi:hypothetical protein
MWKSNDLALPEIYDGALYIFQTPTKADAVRATKALNEYEDKQGELRDQIVQLVKSNTTLRSSLAGLTEVSQFDKAQLSRCKEMLGAAGMWIEQLDPNAAIVDDIDQVLEELP